MASIFHLVRRGELWACIQDDTYAPPSLEREGFVHCAQDVAVALEVADSYFRGSDEPVLLLELDVEALGVPCRFEAPRPLSETTLAARHHAPGRLFPHVYGAIPLRAVKGAYLLLEADEGGAFVLGPGPLAWSALRSLGDEGLGGDG